MKITKIEKKKRLYLIQLDNAENLYVTEDTIVRFMLSKDKTLTPEELADIQHFAQFSYGKNLALYLISFKPRTRREVYDYLVKHEIDTTIINPILDDLEADNWINDRKFVENFIAQNEHSGDKGPFVLKQKLSQKGIKARLIDEVLADFDFSEVAVRVAQKLVKKYQNKLSSKGLQDKVVQNMTSKGFSYQEAKTALALVDIDQNEDAQEALLYRELDKHYRKYSRKYEGYDLKQRLTQALARKGFNFDDIRVALRDFL